MAASAFAEKANNCSLKVPSSEWQIRPLLERLEQAEDRITVWRDVLATTGGAKLKATSRPHRPAWPT
jgi:hypothetical protein